MPDVTFKLMSETPVPDTGAVHHLHGVFEGNQQIGAALVRVKDGKPNGFKVKGLKMKHMSPLIDHLNQTYKSDMAKSKSAPADKQAQRESASLKHMPGASSGSSPDMTPGFQQESGRSNQRAVCTTPDCGGRLQFSERRNKHGFTQTWQSCPNCKAESVVPRRPASMADAVLAAREDAGRAAWKQADLTKAAAAEPKMPDDLDHDRIRVKRAVVALLGKKETPHSPDGKVNAAVDKDQLAKALVAANRDQAFANASTARIKQLRPQLQRMMKQVVSRDEFHPRHDHAAFYMANADHLVTMAERHLQKPSPSWQDRVHSAVNMKPLHARYLDHAESFVRAAQEQVHLGDRAQFANMTTLKPPVGAPPKLSLMDRFVVRSATKKMQDFIPGAADALKKYYRASLVEQNQGSAAPKAKAKKARPKAPQPAPDPND